jgi:hypothetical protein
MSKIYKVDVQTIFTGTGIEGYDCETYVFLDKAKAFQYAYMLAKEYAIEHGLPETNEEKIDWACRLDNKEGLATIEQKDSNFDIKQITITEKYFEDYMKRQLIKGEVTIGSLEINNNYRWPDYGVNGYSIYVFENDFNEDDDVIFEAWFNETK